MIVILNVPLDASGVNMSPDLEDILYNRGSFFLQLVSSQFCLKIFLNEFFLNDTYIHFIVPYNP